MCVYVCEMGVKVCESVSYMSVNCVGNVSEMGG
jgi:hypothetical protein